MTNNPISCKFRSAPRAFFSLGNNRFNQGRLPSRAICTKFRSFEPARYMWVAQLRRMPAEIRMCACVRTHSRTYTFPVRVCARTRAEVSFSFRFSPRVFHRLSRPLSPLSVPQRSGSLFRSVAGRALFSRVCGRRSVACHEEREDEEWKMRGAEGEKKRRGDDGERETRKREAPKRRRKEREREPGEPRGSIGGHQPPQKSAHYHPPGTKGRRRRRRSLYKYLP